VPRTVEVALFEAADDVAQRLTKRAAHLTAADRETHLGYYRLAVAKEFRGVPGADAAFAADPECIRPGVEHIADALEVDAEVLVRGVQNVWPEVRCPGTPLTRALERAYAHPVTLGERFGRHSARFRRFVGLAYWLQRERPDEAMPLPVKAIARLLGLSEKTGWATVREYRTTLARPDIGMLRLESALYAYAGKRTAKTFWFNFSCPHYTPPEVAAQEAT
jgi:hypothetical protein